MIAITNLFINYSSTIHQESSVPSNRHHHVEYIDDHVAGAVLIRHYFFVFDFLFISFKGTLMPWLISKYSKAVWNDLFPWFQTIVHLTLHRSSALCWGTSVLLPVLQASQTPPTLKPVHHPLRWSEWHWECRETMATMNPMVLRTWTRKRCLPGRFSFHSSRFPSTCTTWSTCRGLCFESCCTWLWYSLVSCSGRHSLAMERPCHGSSFPCTRLLCSQRQGILSGSAQSCEFKTSTSFSYLHCLTFVFLLHIEFEVCAMAGYLYVLGMVHVKVWNRSWI